jgi:hypothetical protein
MSSSRRKRVSPKKPLEQPPTHCDTCREVICVADGISYGSIETGYRELCSRCFNEGVAREGGLDFQHVRFEPIEVRDAYGALHQFHFRLLLLGDRVAIKTFEIDARRARRL